MEQRVTGILLIVAFAAIATATGVRTGYETVDVDEYVYRQTLLEMRHGKGYYEATADALAVKERARPSQVRSIRPPTMFLLLRWFPIGSWRWLAGLVYLATLLAVWRLALAFGGWAACLAVVFAGMWVVSFSYYLFLHTEMWGAPCFLAGLVAYRRGDDRRAAALMVVATAMRELFGLGLLLGLVFRRRRPWVVALVVVGVLGLVHAELARHVLEAGGREARFGDEHRTLRFLLTLVSPGGDRMSHVVGLGGLALGLTGLARTRRADPAAALVLPFVVVMLVLSVWSTRVYWSAVWAPPLMAFVPGAVVARETPAVPVTEGLVPG